MISNHSDDVEQRLGRQIRDTQILQNGQVTRCTGAELLIEVAPFCLTNRLGTDIAYVTAFIVTVDLLVIVAVVGVIVNIVNIVIIGILH